MRQHIIEPRIEIDEAVYVAVKDININTFACRQMLTEAGLPDTTISNLMISVKMDSNEDGFEPENKLTLGRYYPIQHKVELYISDIMHVVPGDEIEAQCNATLLHELGHVVDNYHKQLDKEPLPYAVNAAIAHAKLFAVGMTVVIPAVLLLQRQATRSTLSTSLILVASFYFGSYLFGGITLLIKKRRQTQGELYAESFVQKFQKKYFQLLWIDALSS
jgi:hypothetical protein